MIMVEVSKCVKNCTLMVPPMVVGPKNTILAIRLSTTAEIAKWREIDTDFEHFLVNK